MMCSDKHGHDAVGIESQALESMLMPTSRSQLASQLSLLQLRSVSVHPLVRCLPICRSVGLSVYPSVWQEIMNKCLFSFVNHLPSISQLLKCLCVQLYRYFTKSKQFYKKSLDNMQLFSGFSLFLLSLSLSLILLSYHPWILYLKFKCFTM